MNDTITIQVKKTTRNALLALGRMYEDYNSVIEGLIREHNSKVLVEHSCNFVAERKDEFVSIDEL
ncbi:MAG: hypothetical protein Q8J68_01200 [Methanolobus sp.]|uniref:hypothetical protein n=1 Tax=Methanolobus sp. TaxID=1874737 RepID=UPI0027311AFC|nr:hypothetical protein [Methanolobus sp.]MDP2215898.1 hypothetical protein [Methanolobus sp.]